MSNDNNNDKLPKYISYGTPVKTIIKFCVSFASIAFPPVRWFLDLFPKGDLMTIILPLTVYLIYKILPFNNDYYLVKETYQCKKCHKKVTVTCGKDSWVFTSRCGSIYKDEIHTFEKIDTNYIKLVEVDSKENAICSFKGRYWRIKG